METDHADSGYVAKCLNCETVGPVKDSREAARRALLEMGERE